MRRPTILIALLAALHLSTGSAQADQQPTCKAKAKQAYERSHWRSQPRTDILVGCPESEYIRKEKLGFFRYRRYRQVAPFRSPIGSGPPRPSDKRFWAIPWSIVCGESGGNFRVNADGAYQIIPSTWRVFGGGRFASVAGAASPLEQHIIAHAAWGETPWYGLC